MEMSTNPEIKDFAEYPPKTGRENSALPFNSGSSYCIPLEGISAYYKKLKKQVQQIKINKQNDLVPEVLNMKKEILSNEDLNKILKKAINFISVEGVLHECSIEDLFLMINYICTEPPQYEETSFVGIPFAALFIDLMNNESGQQFFSSQIVNEHIREVFNAYKRMLDSPISLRYITCEEPNGWLCPTASKNTNWSEYYVDKEDLHWGFKSFNDFFTRPIRPEARPVDQRLNSIVHSSDSSPLYFSSEIYGKNPTFNVQARSHFWLKDNQYSLYDIFEAENNGIKTLVDEHFVGGTVYQAILCPWYYHRWHAPISGTIVKQYKIGGKYFMLNPSFGLGGIHGGIENYVKSLPMLSMVSVREIIIIKINDGSGRLVALVEIGMTEVSSCCPTVKQGQYVNKGDQIGYFQYGGSSYALIFDKDFKLEFNSNISVPNEKGMVKLQHVNSHLASFA